MPAGMPDVAAVAPTRPLDATTVGSACIGTPNRAHNSELHCMEVMSNNMVRLAFDASVTNEAPCVRFQMIQESMVPSASCGVMGTLPCCSNHSIFEPEKYGSRTRPVFARTSGSSDASSPHRSAVRRSCHTIALPYGLPVSLSHARTVSR